MLNQDAISLDSSLTPQLGLSRLWRWSVPALATVLALGAAAAAYGYHDVQRVDALAEQALAERDDARRILQAAVDLESSSRGFLLSGKYEQLEDYHAALSFLDRERGKSITLVDRGLNELREASLADAIETTLRTRSRAIDSYVAGGLPAVLENARRGDGKRATDDVRRLVGVYVADREATATALHLARGWRQTVVLCLIVFSALTTIIALALAQRLLSRRQKSAEKSRAASDRRRSELAALVEMSELLQSGAEAQDIRTVVAHAARRLLPGQSGWLFAFNNSRDRLDLAASWRGSDVPQAEALGEPPEHFAPSECWALKRGRPHHGDPSEEGGGLGCSACAATGKGLCVPMAARGEVQGVLRIAFGANASGLHEEQTALATALGDSVSLSLANLALRERLRGQALRDSLTGLHNRRFLEEVMAQMEAQLTRDGRPVAVLMMDLDHFKSINDGHGHAIGDAVLRAVGALLTSQLRRSDVACRYGGEELAVLLPGCDVEGALERAEEIRQAVAMLHTTTAPGAGAGPLPAVTVSIGVAAAPQSSARIVDALQAADAALYDAKRSGRNKVVAAVNRAAATQHARLEIVQARPAV